ncbi:YybH family protein [Mesorhizobium japonicum]|jgi:ketosteroid isomerase-like protein|uniref:YybH family protein n=1 Tax=Mesorhizobium japonicum TaxID=2066070 RepID=UPI003B5A7243
MTDQQRVRAWVDGYRRAWESNDEREIRALFTGDAVYRAHPSDPGEVGVDAIVAAWLRDRDEPGDTTFEVRTIHLDGDTAFVRAVTDYVHHGDVYDNLWVVEFAADGRASGFTEWYVKRPVVEDPAVS